MRNLRGGIPSGLDQKMRSRAKQLLARSSALACLTILLEPGALRGAELSVGVGADAQFHTIQAALDHAKAGDKIHVRAGVYRERVEFKTGGTKDHPVTLEGEPGAIIDGSENIALDWQPAPEIGPGVYKAVVDFFPFTITVDGKIITTLDEKRVDPDKPGPIHNGWSATKWPDAFRKGIGPSGWTGVHGLAMYRTKPKELLIRLQDGADPRKATITVAPRKPCVKISGQDRCVIRGLTLRYAATGLSVENSLGTVIEQCKVGPVDYGIELRPGADSATIRFNDISYQPYAGADYTAPGQWDAWQACKTDGFHDRRAVEMHLTRGGHQIHDNYIHDEWDGVDSSATIYDPKPKYEGDAGTNQRVSVHHNLFYNIFDDGIETASPMAHAEYHDNVFRHCRCAFRIKAPSLGPIFSYRNIFLENGEDYRDWNEYSDFVACEPGMLTAEVWLYQNTSTSRAAVNMNYSAEAPWEATAPNYHYVNNLFWCRYWVGKSNEKIPAPDWKGEGNVFVRVTPAEPQPWPVAAAGSTAPSEATFLQRWDDGLALAKHCGIDEHSLWVADRSPGFADSAHENMALKPDSVAREKGIDLSKVRTADGSPLPGTNPGYFKGKQPDAGALQLGEAMLVLPRKVGEVQVPAAGSWP